MRFAFSAKSFATTWETTTQITSSTVKRIHLLSNTSSKRRTRTLSRRQRFVMDRRNHHHLKAPARCSSSEQTDKASTSGKNPSSSPPPPPLFKFGLLADIQYCDTDDRTNFSGSQVRRYRNALNVARNAVEHFNLHHQQLEEDTTTLNNTTTGGARSAKTPGIDFIVHNGDIIDHQCAFDFQTDSFKPLSEGRRQLADVMQILDRSACRDWIFTIGNHELYNFTRRELIDGVDLKKEGIESYSKDGLTFKCASEDGDLYYAKKPHEKWKVIILNPYDVSIYSKGREQGLDEEALSLLRKHNPNADKWCDENPDVVQTERMSGTFPYFKDLEGLNGRWVPFNGGVGATQLEWLRAELKRSKENEEKVLIFCHLLVHPKTTSGTGRTLLWNYDEVLEVIQKVGDGCVKCVFSGHQHEGGVHVDELGTHFVVLESPMLASDEDKGHPGPFCVVEVNETSVLMKGFGRSFESRLFPYEEGLENVEALEYKIAL